ncbi:MAG: hypothetical protein KH420_05090 [Clostridiales bacterium]|nr:hypothetical protein [Clostridiales bacterium]
MRKKPYIIVGALVIIIFAALEISDLVLTPEPPEMDGQLWMSQIPVESELLVQNWLYGTNQIAEQFHLGIDGSVKQVDENYILTTGGLVTEATYEQMMAIDQGMFIDYLQTETGGVFAFLQRKPTDSHYFTIYDWSETAGVIFQIDIPKMKKNPSILTMQKEGDMIYLFDYDNYENPNGIFLIAINEQTGTLQTWELSWREIVGEADGRYRLRDMVLNSGNVVVYDGVLYLAESSYPNGDGVRKVLLSAYDLEREQRIGGDDLGQDPVIAFGHSEQELHVLTNPHDWNTIQLHSYSAKTMQKLGTVTYELPAEWTARVPRENQNYALSLADVTADLVFVVLPVQDETENSADLVAYLRESGEMVWYGTVQLNETGYEIRKATFHAVESA